MRHIISILLQNEAGALTRVASLFSTRGYNIESLSVAPTEDPAFSRLTLVTLGSDQVIDQINKQLLKLVDVVSLADMTRGDHIERELLLLKLKVPEAAAERLQEFARREGVRVLDDNRAHYTLEFTSTCGRIDDFVEKAGNLATILTVVRSGPMAMARGTPATVATLAAALAPSGADQ
jgi:acetolactate synthase-1/3 small subunit